MKYLYTDTSQLDVNFSMTLFDIERLVVVLEHTDDQEHHYFIKNMILTLRNASEITANVMERDALTVRESMKTPEGSHDV
jgi:hypothetical protein